MGTAIAGQQFEYEYEYEGEYEGEYEYEHEYEGEYEYETLPQPEALAEAFAAMASRVQSEAEAEAYIGAATARTIPIISASMGQVSPKLVRGAATLTRTLRKSPSTRSLVRVLPTILTRVGHKLKRMAAQGKRITPAIAARVMANETRKVLGSPVTAAKSLLLSSQDDSQVAAPAPQQRRQQRQRRRQPVLQ
ncbi:hypothetical protein DP117_26750 [Brasilonema sp. UFV-L1]|nr:hypothetical protein [Brasilonema sp. UFV-L1]